MLLRRIPLRRGAVRHATKGDTSAQRCCPACTTVTPLRRGAVRHARRDATMRRVVVRHATRRDAAMRRVAVRHAERCNDAQSGCPACGKSSNDAQSGCPACRRAATTMRRVAVRHAGAVTRRCAEWLSGMQVVTRRCAEWSLLVTVLHTVPAVLHAGQPSCRTSLCCSLGASCRRLVLRS